MNARLPRTTAAHAIASGAIASDDPASEAAASKTAAPRDKRLVAQQFSRAATSYLRAAGVQQRARDGLLQALPPAIDGHWLDIGCGPGPVLPHLLRRGAHRVTGLDLAAGMIAEARSRLNDGCQLLQADAEALPLADASCAGIFSSLMLQWSQQPQRALQEWARVLQPGGTLAIATLLPGTQRELQQAWASVDERPHVNRFLPAAGLIRLLTQSGLQLRAQQQQRITEHYPDLTTLLRTLKAIGATNVNPGRSSGLGGRRALQQLAQAYPGQPGCLPLSYEVLWVLAEKSA